MAPKRNEAHAIMDQNASRVIISFRGVKLYELGEVEDDRLYQVKVPLSHLVIEAPKELSYEVERPTIKPTEVKHHCIKIRSDVLVGISPRIGLIKS